jgi:hypothetical protein
LILRVRELIRAATVTGALITGFTALSGATAFRIYLSERGSCRRRSLPSRHAAPSGMAPAPQRKSGRLQFPTALRRRGYFFSESGRSAPFIPLLFGRETVGQLETVSEGVAAPA